MANDAEVKKCLPNNVQTQCTGSKIWSRDEAEGGIIKSCVKTSERSKLVPHSAIRSHKPFGKDLCASQFLSTEQQSLQNTKVLFERDLEV